MLGGTCLNVGCIPSKSLLNNSHLYHTILHDTKKRGIDVGEVSLNLKQMMKAKDDSVSGLTKGVEFLFKKNKVDYIRGTGSFADEHSIDVNLIDGGQTQIRGKNIIIATGSESTPFPGLEIDEKKVITSTGAIALTEVPKKMVVIGGGIIGLEMVNLHRPCDASSLTWYRHRYGHDSAQRSPSSNSLDRSADPAWTQKSQNNHRRYSASKV